MTERRTLMIMKVVMACFILHASCFISSCARMGQPDGGWYDDTPPHVVSTTPQEQGTQVTARRIVINFNEYIKLDDAQNKVIISPPQTEQPEIKAAGRRIIVELKDSLRDSTTYTIDFSDAIQDNNEGNPMGGYTFSFSTGDHIDTLEVAGYVLAASDLEPVQGILVGLYDNLSDTIVRSEPMIRVSRTDSRGRFAIKGVAPGNYRVYALQDADGDFLFNQKSEAIAFLHDIIVPSWKPDTRQDTIWRDSLRIDNIVQVPYTHFLPDDVTLLSFQETQTDRYLLKTERAKPENFTFYFSYGHDSIPHMEGLNFVSDSAFVVEASEHRDTVTWWLRDTTLVNQDTLTVKVDFYATDTLGQLVLQTDTLNLIPKMSYERRMKEQQRTLEQWAKQQERKKKRGEDYDSIPPVDPLNIEAKVGVTMSPLERVFLEYTTPLLSLDSTAVHLYSQIDSVWYEAPFRLKPLTLRSLEVLCDWREGVEYSLEIDSAAFCDLYGKVNVPLKEGFKVLTQDDYSSLTLQLQGLPDTAQVVVQLLSGQDEPVRTAVAEGGKVTFTYLKAGKYYVRCFEDRNRNGKWDTGLYDDDCQPEDVYYFPEDIECKQKWDVSRTWDVKAVPRYRQKPLAITKQKPEKAKQLRNRNADRAKKLGIPPPDRPTTN